MKKPKKRTVVILVLVAGAAIAAAAFFPRKPPLLVTVAMVENVAELKAMVNGTGEIRTEDKADIQTEIAGVIVELPVREGDKVEKDTVLVKIDPVQTEADVHAARAALSALEADAAGQAFQIASSEANAARDEFLKKSAEVELRQSDTNLARAQEAFNRDKKLFDATLIPSEQFEVTETQLKLNMAQVEVSRVKIQQLDVQIKASQADIEFARSTRDAVLKRVEGSRSSLRRSEDLLNKTTIRAPFTGVIVKLNVKKGERAVPGVLSSPQATLMTIADFSVIEAELKVDETDIVNVKLGDVGKVVVDALPDTSLVGHVSEIGNSPITSASGGGMGGGGNSQEGKDFKVVLRIDNPPASLRPGMSCEGDITTSVRKDVSVIPIQALTLRDVRVDADGRYQPPKPDEAAGSGLAAAASSASDRRKELQGVFLCGPGDKAQFRPVKTGIIGEMDVEILEGLSLGEEVVVGPLKALRSIEENTKIQIDRSKPFRRLLRKRGVSEDEQENR